MAVAVWVVLACSAACRADDPTPAANPAGTAAAVVPAQAAAPAQSVPDAGSTRQGRSQPNKVLTLAQRIEVNVRRLTKGLDLDSGQQEKLRQILMDQHLQIMALRKGNAPAGTDVAATSMAIYTHTKERIRALLNEDQLQKYSVEVPRDQLAPAHADLGHWMDLQDAKRREGLSEVDSK